MIRFKGPGELAGYLGGLLGRLRAIQRCVQVNALAATGHRDRVMADVTQDVADELCNPSTRRKIHPWPRVKIKNKAIRILRLPIRPEPPLRHMDLKSGQLGEPGKRRKII